MPAFHPAAVRGYAVQARALAIELIEGFYDAGRCDFVGEFSLVMPLSIFMSIVDLPVADRVSLHDLVRRSSRSPTQEARTAAFQQIADYLETWIERRRATPGDDLLSKIIHAELDGRPLSRQEVLGAAILLLFAGLDTVAAMMAFVMRHLAEHPPLRAWLIANPDKIASAVEELMRRHGVANNVRTATIDVELDGVTLRRGDYIVVPNCLHGLDERQFPHALDVDFSRQPGQTGTFGWGPHHCAGANLARVEMRVLLEEWLARIPDFEVDPDAPVLEQTGTVNGVLQLPLRWTPAPR
jgi:cytochrome P450